MRSCPEVQPSAPTHEHQRGVLHAPSSTSTTPYLSALPLNTDSWVQTVLICSLLRRRIPTDVGMIANPHAQTLICCHSVLMILGYIYYIYKDGKMVEWKGIRQRQDLLCLEKSAGLPCQASRTCILYKEPYIFVYIHICRSSHLRVEQQHRHVDCSGHPSPNPQAPQNPVFYP